MQCTAVQFNKTLEGGVASGIAVQPSFLYCAPSLYILINLFYEEQL